MNSKHFTLDLLSSFQIKHYFGPLVGAVSNSFKGSQHCTQKEKIFISFTAKLLSRNHSKFLKHFVYGDRPA